MPPVPRPVRRLLLPLLLALASLLSCAETAGPKLLAIMPGVVNRPDNRTLRFALLRYGLDQFCAQMTRSSAPIRTSDELPVVGRFYPQTCNVQLVDDDVRRQLVAQFGGYGYLWTNLTQRVGFQAGGLVQYEPDFQIEGGAMYVYFRAQGVPSSDFRLTMIESPIAAGVAQVLPGDTTARIAKQVFDAELGRGFTAVRYGDGSVDFQLGLLPKGQKPFHPYEVKGSGRVTLANERSEVQPRQRDFLGPYEVDADGRALYLALDVDGAPAVDVMVLPKAGGDPWLSTYVSTPQAGPPPYAPLMDEVVPAEVPWRKALPVAKGSYYVVVDNTATAGRVYPAGDRAALAQYVVQVGDAP